MNDRVRFTSEEVGYIRGVMRNEASVTEAAMRKRGLTEEQRAVLETAYAFERSILAKIG